MFDLPANDSGAADNSVMNIIKELNSMDPSKNNLVNCPLVLTGMSHEMRTHMNAIVAFSFLMKENCTNGSDKEEYSNLIFSSCEQLIGLFDNFFDTAIINMGNTINDSRTCKLDNVMDDLFTEFRNTIKTQDSKDLELITEKRYSDSLRVLVDRNKISRIMRTLFHNSLKATDSGYIKIGCQYIDEKVTFYVIDSGQGYFKCKEFLCTENMNESLLIHNDLPTAISITLAKKLIQILGGTIRIESNELSGTGIFFSIPVKEVVSPDIPNNKRINTMISI
jgi:K+-sensing histidine kinase KdpD